MSFKVFHRVLRNITAANLGETSARRTLTCSNCHNSFHASDSSPIGVDVSSPQDENNLFMQENRSFRWDPNSGQFSFCQASDNLLSQGVSLLASLSSSQPESIAILQRQYTDIDSYEVGVNFESLQKRVSDIRALLSNVLADDQGQGVVVMFLPVSVVAVASILAGTASSVRHSLVFAGFSSQALHQLLDSGLVSCVLTDHDHCHKVQRLLQDPLLQRGNISVIYLDSGRKDFISDLENHHIDPIFALYTGGPSSLIAGTGELTGFYQATSCVQPQREDNLSDIVEAGHKEEAGKQPSFYEQKLKNNYRLPHIKDILDQDR